MADVQVTCITKPKNGSHEHITHIGNPAGNWKWTVQDVIKSIDEKTNMFHVVDARTGKRAYVGVVRPDNHAPYIRTYADGVWNDNLLSLPNCS